MREQQPKGRKSPAFGSIANQTGALKIGGRSKQESDIPETIPSSVSAFQKSIPPIDPDEKRKQQTAYIPASLQKWLRIRAPIEERDISDIVTDALLAYREKVEREQQAGQQIPHDEP